MGGGRPCAQTDVEPPEVARAGGETTLQPAVAGFVDVVQVFTEPFLLTNGGPSRETLTPTMHIYNRAFIRLDMGYASAWSVTLILVLVTFSIVYRIVNARLSQEK